MICQDKNCTIKLVQKFVESKHCSKHQYKVYGNYKNVLKKTNRSTGETTYIAYGEPHRENGPAVIIKKEDKMFYKKGKLHREDGPAVETASGTQEWWINGQLHREDGPAKIFFNGEEKYYIDGKELYAVNLLLENKYRMRKKSRVFV